MTRTTISGAAGFGRMDMSGLARRQLRMSLGLVAFLAAATVFAGLATGAKTAGPAGAAPTASMDIQASPTRG